MFDFKKLLTITLLFFLVFTQLLSVLPSPVKAESEANIANLEVIGEKPNEMLVDETDVAFNEGDTAFDFLKQVVGEEQIDYTESANGIMLTGIKKVSPKKDSTTFWAFYINGVSSQVGVNDYKLQPGDSITFILKDWTAPSKNIATLSVQGNDNIKDIQVDFINSPTVFDVIRVMVGKKELKFEEYDFGNLVTSIDGVTNTENQFWLVYVNDQALEVSIDKYKIKNGDHIEFKYETFSDSSNSQDDGKENPKQITSESLEKVLDHTIKFALKDGISDWEALSLSKLGEEIPDSYKKTLKQNVREASKTGAKVTELEKYALALLAIGGDPTDFEGNNLVKQILNEDVEKQGLNGVAYALIVLQSTNYSDSKGTKWSKDKLINYLLDNQNNDGGWNWALGADSDLDSTAIVLTALAPFKEQVGVKEAVELALQYIKPKIQGNEINNSSTAAELLFAICSLGFNPQGKEFSNESGNLVTKLTTYQNEDGGFYWKKGEQTSESDPFSTEYALRALTAYQLYLDKQESFYAFNVDQSSNETNNNELEAENNMLLFYLLIAAFAIIVIIVIAFYLKKNKK